jgi:hypothetical protein
MPYDSPVGSVFPNMAPENKNAGVAQWTPHQRLFAAGCNPGVAFNAEVDGYSVERNGSVKVIVEAKRSWQPVHEPAVSMQEATEVIAWLKCDTAVHNR